jgi:hypothetical protein
MPSMDFDRSDRELAALMAYQGASLKEQKAARKAQDSYNKKKLKLEKQGLGLQADQIAKQYAMDQARLEWDKESFRQQFGEEQFQNKWQREFEEKQAALDETWRTAEQTGFRDGVPTLSKLQFDEQTRQFNVTQKNNERDFGEDVRRFDANFGEDKRRYDQDFGEDTRRYDQDFGEGVRRYDQDFGEGQRQFNVGSVLNAPRGPADWAAYRNRLRGLQDSGSLMFGNDPVASFSNGGQATGPVLSNTDLALAVTGQGDPTKLQGTPWQGVGEQVYRTQGGGQSDLSLANAAAYRTTQPVSDVGYGAGQADTGARPASFKTNSSNPYGAGNDGPSSAGAAASALGIQQPQQSEQAGPAPRSQSALSIPSLQRFRKFNPTEQAMGLGELEEAGIATADDAQWQMQRQAPLYGRSRSARMAGV